MKQEYRQILNPEEFPDLFMGYRPPAPPPLPDRPLQATTVQACGGCGARAVVHRHGVALCAYCGSLRTVETAGRQPWQVVGVSRMHAGPPPPPQAEDPGVAVAGWAPYRPDRVWK